MFSINKTPLMFASGKLIAHPDPLDVTGYAFREKAGFLFVSGFRVQWTLCARWKYMHVLVCS
jgi:hypothetical protein